MLVYLALRAGAALAGAVPFRLVIRIGEWLGRLVPVFVPARRAMVERHGRRIGVDDGPLHVRRVFGGYGRYWAEALWTRPRRRDEILAATDTVGLDRVVAARDAGGGMIYALPHMGNWEFAAPVATELGVEVVAVAENLANRRIRNWFVELRNGMGIRIVLATGAAQVMRDLDAAIGRNAAVALLCDRDLRRRGVEVDFFGESTTMPAGPASLAIRTGAPLFPVASYFTPGGHKVVVRPAIEIPDVTDRAERVRATTQLLARELETLIREAPDQWHLVLPNWPSDFGGATESPM